ncbi:MAG: tyrosine-protein phosphatase [Myxococcota bacterium]
MLASPRRAAGLALGLCLLAAGFGCARLLYNFGEVEPGRIYRGGQPSPLFLRRLVERQGIRTLINLRGKTQGYESAFAARHGLRLFAFDLSSRRPPSDEEIARFLAILSDPQNHPIMVHCRNGADRTGYMIGIYRTNVSGWTLARSEREMRRYFQRPRRNPVPQQIVRDRLSPAP